MKLKVSVTGYKEIDQALSELPLSLTHKVLGAAHYAAAKPLVDAARLSAPEGPTGHLVDSIGALKVSQKRADIIGEVNVGPRRRGRYKGYHGHLVEFGTRPRETKKKHANRGVMPAHPFMRPSFSSTKDTVEKLIAINVGRQVVRVMKKYLKK